jgi:predicted nuclease of predicted toxin-antitoxin system
MPGLCGRAGEATDRCCSMKLLFDQNLSFKLVDALSPAFPGSKHLKDFSLTREEDVPLWSFAAENGFTIVSKDSDFLHLSMLRGHPPKVVHVRLGNCSTRRITDQLVSEAQTIRDFIADPHECFMIIE